MALNKQIHIYSVDTSAFYTTKEEKIHWKITKLRNEKRYLNELIENFKFKISTIGFGEKEISQMLNKNFDIQQYKEKLEDFEYCLLVYLVKNVNYYNGLKTYKNNLIKTSKDNLLSILNTKAIIKTRKNKKRNKIVKENARELNSKHLIEKNVISVFESSLTRMLKLAQDELSKDIIIVKVYYFDILKDLILNGFVLNGEEYKCFTASAGQIRTKKTVFIKKALWDKYEKTLMCGLTLNKINEKGGVNINKFLAYLALSNSATDLWSKFDINKCVVVDDFETMVEGEVDLIDDESYTVNRIKMDVPIPHTDGCGMVLPNVSNKNFMIRLPWVKGLLAVFDFKRFVIENKCSTKIKDIYGKEWDVLEDDIQIIFTKSQFKMHKYYADWSEYQSKFIEYNCQAGICNMEENRIKDAKINYQMMQTLTDINDKELKQIAKKSSEKIKNISTTVQSMLEIFGVTKFNMNKTNLQQALEIYPELLNDNYTKSVLYDIKKSLIKKYKSGKLETNGKYTFLIPDLYAFCEWLFMGIENPNGLLKNKEVSCNLYSNVNKLDCLRSPHLYKEHAVRNNVINEETKKWFITKGIYTSCHDLISKILQFDVDGDKSLVIADKLFVSIAERNMNGIVPLYYNMKKASPKILNNSEIYNGLKSAYIGGNIGAISNDITKIWNSEIWSSNDEEKKEEPLNVIKLLCMENNFTIDYAKTLYKPKRKKEINDIIRKYTKLKTPYFFQYTKDKTDDKVERKNNSVVNRLDSIIKDRRLTFNFLDFGKVNYKYLMSNKNIEINNDLINTYSDLNKKYRHKINMKDEKNSNITYIAKEIREKLAVFGYSENDITDMLVKYLYDIKKSKSKESLWFCYGELIVKNLKINIDKKTSVCKKCGYRFEKQTPQQQYCLDCDNSYQPIGTKTIQCVDCGCDVEIDASSRKIRCKKCELEHKRKYEREKKKKQRKK